MNLNPAAADADWLARLPVIGSLPPEVAAAKLREVGEDETADALEEEGEQAAVLGRPVFVGLQVGAEGLFLQCATVNVLNEGDEALLRFLDGDAFKNGLQLLTTAQPVLAPFVALTVGLTQTVAGRNKN